MLTVMVVVIIPPVMIITAMILLEAQVRQLVRTVQAFHAMGFKNHRAVPVGAAPGLKVLEGCARVLLQTIMLEGYASDLEVRVEVHMAM